MKFQTGNKLLRRAVAFLFASISTFGCGLVTSVVSETAQTGSGTFQVMPQPEPTTPAPSPSPSPTPTSTGSSGPFHEPVGMDVQFDTGAMTTPPASTPGNWSEGSATFNMYSPGGSSPPSGQVGISSSQTWTGFLTLVPGGTGLRQIYPSNLVGGYNSVVFGVGFPDHGTGTLYVRYKIRFSPNWTSNDNIGTKMMEPETYADALADAAGTSPKENHVLGTGSDYGSSDHGDSQYGAGNHVYPQLVLQGPSDSVDFPAGDPTLADSSCWALGCNYLTAATGADLAGASAGNWHTVEWLLQMESPGGAQNGSVTIWMDGTEIYTHSGFNYIATGETPGWSYMMFNSTYGGGKNSPPDEIYWDLDQFHLSVK